MMFKLTGFEIETKGHFPITAVQRIFSVIHKNIISTIYLYYDIKHEQMNIYIMNECSIENPNPFLLIFYISRESFEKILYI